MNLQRPTVEVHDDLNEDGTCSRMGCLLHSGPATEWMLDTIPPGELPSGGDGNPYFPGGIGCDVDGCDTLWATADSAAKHAAWHQS